eukprot:1789252-Rhodomonas_salina.5
MARFNIAEADRHRLVMRTGLGYAATPTFRGYAAARRYAVSGTKLGYAATRLDAESGTDLGSRPPYALSGTAVALAATGLCVRCAVLIVITWRLCNVQYWHRLRYCVSSAGSDYGAAKIDVQY